MFPTRDDETKRDHRSGITIREGISTLAPPPEHGYLVPRTLRFPQNHGRDNMTARSLFILRPGPDPGPTGTGSGCRLIPGRVSQGLGFRTSCVSRLGLGVCGHYEGLFPKLGYFE